jgi:hypothetical protein
MELLSSIKREFIDVWRRDVARFMQDGSICQTVIESVPAVECDEEPGLKPYEDLGLQWLITNREEVVIPNSYKPLTNHAAVKFGYAHRQEERKRKISNLSRKLSTVPSQPQQMHCVPTGGGSLMADGQPRSGERRQSGGSSNSRTRHEQFTTANEYRTSRVAASGGGAVVTVGSQFGYTHYPAPSFYHYGIPEEEQPVYAQQVYGYPEEAMAANTAPAFRGSMQTAKEIHARYSEVQASEEHKSNFTALHTSGKANGHSSVRNKSFLALPMRFQVNRDSNGQRVLQKQKSATTIQHGQGSYVAPKRIQFTNDSPGIDYLGSNMMMSRNTATAAWPV